MFKFFVHHAFQIANHFHQFHLRRNRSWHESKLALVVLHLYRQLLSRGVPSSLLTMRFPAIVLLLVRGAETEADSEFNEGRRVSEFGRSDGL
jgi:hypothetical protein